MWVQQYPIAVALLENLGFGRVVEVTRVASRPLPQQCLCNTFDRWSFSFCLNTSNDKELRAAKWRLLLILQDHDRMSSALESFSQFTQADQLLHALQSLSTWLSPHHSMLPWELSFYIHICLSYQPQNISRKCVLFIFASTTPNTIYATLMCQ